MRFTYSSLLLSCISLLSQIEAAGLNPVLNGSPAQMNPNTGGTYPRANPLGSSAIIGAFTGFSGGNNIITLVESINGGSSWTNLGSAATENSTTNDLDNPYPLRLPSGRLVIAFRNHDRVPGSDPAQYTYYRIVLSYSDDNGANWLYLSTPAQSSTIGLWEPFMRIAADGTTLQLYYSRLYSSTDQDSILLTSADGGQTWSAEQTISGQDITSRDGMLGVATIGTGSELLAVFECEQNGLFVVDSVSSSDGGITWGNRRNVYTPTGSSKNAGAPQVINVGGTLVVSFMTNEDTSGTASDWPNNAEVKLVTSSDGVSFGNKITVGGSASFWPGLVSTSDTSFLYLYQGAQVFAQAINLT
jgi:hypothetical protein